MGNLKEERVARRYHLACDRYDVRPSIGVGWIVAWGRAIAAEHVRAHGCDGPRCPSHPDYDPSDADLNHYNDLPDGAELAHRQEQARRLK